MHPHFPLRWGNALLCAALLAALAPAHARDLTPIDALGVAPRALQRKAAPQQALPAQVQSLSREERLGLPTFASPVFEAHAMTVIVPVAIILVAENLGHIKAVSAMTGQDLDGSLYVSEQFPWPADPIAENRLPDFRRRACTGARVHPALRLGTRSASAPRRAAVLRAIGRFCTT